MNQESKQFFQLYRWEGETRIRAGALEISLILAIFLGFLGLTGIFQILFTQPISLNGGLGYDGGWYIEAASKPFSRTDSMHIFRQLPSLLVWLITAFLKTIQLDKFMVVNEIRSFQLLNLSSILISCIYLEKIAAINGFSGKKKMLFLLLTAGGFCFIRDAFFNPVMTDSLSWLQTIVLIYLMIKQKTGLFFYIVCLATLFTNPFPLLILTLTYAFKNLKFIEVKKSGVNLFALLSAFAIAVAFAVISYNSTIAKGIYTFYEFPDEANPGLLLPTILLHSLLLFSLFYLALSRSLFPDLLVNIKKLNIKMLAVFTAVVCIILVVNRIYPHKFDAGTSDPFLVMALWWNFKPLIGFIDSTSYFGLVMPLFLVFYRKTGRLIISEYGFGGVVILGAGLLFLMKTEARHALVFIPFLSVAVVKSMPMFSNAFLATSLLLNLFLSKIWYPLHLAKFTDHQYQAYPAQHYFAFLGPTLAWWPYYLFLAIFLAIFLFYHLWWRALTKSGTDPALPS